MPDTLKVKSRVPNILGRAIWDDWLGKRPSVEDVQEHTAEYWHKDAQFTLYKQLVRQQNVGTAKNIIMFLGDGMSLSTVTAARIHKGQLNGKRGEEEELSFDKFPYVGLSKTYCVDRQVADSACSATA